MLMFDEITVKRILKARYGGISSIPDQQWPRGQGMVDRTTLYRCFREKRLPGSALVFSLAGVLDVDPMAIVSVRSDASAGDLFGYFVRSLWGDSRSKDFAKILKMANHLVSGIPWPADEFSSQYYCRDWCRAVFVHDADKRENYYGRFGIEFVGGAMDRVLHFAWRDPSGGTWHPYGAVKISDGIMELICYDGFMQQQLVSRDTGRVNVESWFGSGSAEFCIASLHPFQAWLGGEGSAPTVGFKTLPDR